MTKSLLLLKKFGFVFSDNFRFDINFLRFFSIVSVVTYHYAQKIAPGGFIGVDVFFVISGYLISLNIYQNIELNKFSFLSFYDRRVRRILPALLVFLFFSTILAYSFFYFNELKDYSNLQLSSLFFYTNFYLIEIKSHYFSSNFLPLKHMWSLSIEEQFYIIFPLICFVFYKRNFFFLLILLILIPVLSNFFFESNNFYYNTFFRFHELAIGSLAAYFKIKKYFQFSNRVRYLLTCIGFFIIFSCLYILNGQNFNGFATIVPSFGAFLIIMFNNNNFNFNKYLNFFIFQFIGFISYSLYLYHYFFLIFFSILPDAHSLPSHSTRFILLILSVFIAYCSYLFIEKKFRYL